MRWTSSFKLKYQIGSYSILFPSHQFLKFMLYWKLPIQWIWTVRLMGPLLEGCLIDWVQPAVWSLNTKMTFTQSFSQSNGSWNSCCIENFPYRRFEDCQTYRNLIVRSSDWLIALNSIWGRKFELGLGIIFKKAFDFFFHLPQLQWPLRLYPNCLEWR